MYNVLLVDDELDILETLNKNIDWSSFGVETVLTASSGKVALQKLEELSVNLVITDIKMPGMDGLSLLREIRTKYPHIRCIILSSYREFSYAQEAINLGVENYLLKPINSEELNSTIQNCLTNLEMDKQVMRSLFMDNILHRWVTNDISKDELAERSKHIHVNIYFRNYCVVLFRTPHHASVDGLLRTFLLQLETKQDVYHFVDYSSHHVLIIGGHTIHRAAIQTALEHSLESADCRHDFTAVIGSVVTGSEQVALSYRSALDSMLLSSSGFGQQIISVRDSAGLEVTDYQLNQIVTHLESAVDFDQEISARPLFRELFDNIENQSLSALNSYLSVLSVRLFRLLISLGMIDANTEKDVIVNAYHFLEFPSEEALYECFCNLLNMNFLLIKKHMQQLSPICQLAMQYVAANFTDYVSIKGFCTLHNINASYFGFLFRKETGIYFNDYVNQIRINHAMLLLKNTSHKISQISKMCGFGNTSYFIQCFKKRTGLPPANFKQLISDGEN